MLTQNAQALSASALGMTASTEDVENAEPIMKAKDLSAAASTSSIAWYSSMQSLFTLWHSLALPLGQLEDARIALEKAKQQGSDRLDRHAAEFTAACDKLLSVDQLRMQSTSTTARALESACIDVKQLETQYALHQRIGGVHKEVNSCRQS